jgi:hypothetical protein
MDSPLIVVAVPLASDPPPSASPAAPAPITIALGPVGQDILPVLYPPAPPPPPLSAFPPEPPPPIVTYSIVKAPPLVLLKSPEPIKV